MNVLIAVVASGLLAVVSGPLALVALVLFLGTIYVRGYLIPGTPALTKTYFPDRVLAWFDKDPVSEFTVDVESDDDLDVEDVLHDAGALEECANADDLCLTADFRERWYAEMDRLDEEEAIRTLGEMLGVQGGRISLRSLSRSYAAEVDGSRAGTWESEAAFLADMAAERVLDDRVANWTDLSTERRSGVVRGLRVYLDRCPRCDGTVALADETVKSCCRSREVVASRCRDCGVRLFEIDASQIETTAA